MLIKRIYIIFFLVVIPCLIGLAYVYFFVLHRFDVISEQSEPKAIDEFPLQQEWRTVLDARVDSPLATWKDKVYVRTVDGFYALSVSDGQVLWQLNDLHKIDYEPIFVKDDIAIVQHSEDLILAVDAQTGEIIASISDEIQYSQIESTAIDDNLLYVIQDSYLFIYDIDSGREHEKFVDVGRDVFVNFQENKFILVSTLDIKVFDRQTNTLLSKFTIPRSSDYSPNSNIYNRTRQELILIRGETLYVFDLLEQTLHLKTKISQSKFDPRFHENVLYIATITGKVQEVDLITGNILWETQIPNASSKLQTPNLLNEYLYTKDQRTGRIYAVSLHTKKVDGYLQVGQLRFKTSLPEGINPIIVANRLIFSQGNRVYSYVAK